jgi:hypothetical protein
MTLTTRAWRWFWRTPAGRALSGELDDAHTAIRGANRGYETARREADDPMPGLDS